MYLRLQIRSLGSDTLYSQDTEPLRTAQTISEPLIFMFNVSPVFQMRQPEAVRPDHISTGVPGSLTLVTMSPFSFVILVLSLHTYTAFSQGTGMSTDFLV